MNIIEIRSEIVFDDDEIEEEDYVPDEWVTDMDAFDEKFKDIL